MPLDPRARRFLDRLAALNPPSAVSLSVLERRSALAHLLSFAGTPAAVAAVEDRMLPGPAGALAVRLYAPEDVVAGGLLPGLVYFHGGGLVAGSLDTHDGICRAMTQASGCRVVSVDYRLAPEHRFPAAVEDGCAVMEHVARHAEQFGVDARRLGICGDSAGATLAAVVCQRLVAQRRTVPALQFLLCPITDFAARSASRQELAQGYLVDESTLEHDLRHYLGPDVLADDPGISPLRAADISGLPPACIHTAEFDPLRDEGRAYAERLQHAGVPTRYTCHSGMIHLFYGMGGLFPYAMTAWSIMGAEIRAMLASG